MVNINHNDDTMGIEGLEIERVDIDISFSFDGHLTTLNCKENEDLGKMISSGRLAKLEGELALQKDYSEKMKQNQLEVSLTFSLPPRFDYL